MERLRAFLVDNVLGRSLYTDELTYYLENGKIEGVYSDRMTFSNLLDSGTGVKFDLFVDSHELLYEIDADKNRLALRKDFSSSSVFRYELAKRRGSGLITGFMRFVTSSLQHVPAEAMASTVLDIQVTPDGIAWKEKEMLYRDQPGTGDEYRSVAFEANCRLFLEQAKARYEYDGVCMDVDPKTFARTPSDAIIPKFVAKER